ncbi:MAG: helix-turn-helix transcriptional regulator [Chitinophagaceae bacterium]|nr:helix-turn-helix transcriptional regulator [Chitinophagaceae bacterium]
MLFINVKYILKLIFITFKCNFIDWYVFIDYIFTSIMCLSGVFFMGLKDVFTDYEEFETGVAEELRTQRRIAKISLKEMSEKIGLHANTIAKCEKHEFGIGLEILFGYAKVLQRPLVSFINRYESREKLDGNPVAELTGEEMVRYSQILQNLFGVFGDQGIKLSGGLSFDATKLVAMAIIEQRQLN